MATQSLSPTAMVLAAGLGQRMRPLTLAKPKPLLEIGGRTMLDLALDHLAAHGIRRVVVNAYYLAEQIETHMASRHDIEIIVSREDELLDTGGGIKKAISQFEEKPFFVLNADLPWIDSTQPSLALMEQAWNAARMDALLLVMRTHKARGFDAKGDFMMATDGHLHRQNVQPPRDYVMLSAQILKPEFFTARPETVFSNNLIWNEAETKNRLYGIEHQGTCFHVGTPPDWEQANQLLASGAGWTMP